MSVKVLMGPHCPRCFAADGEFHSDFCKEGQMQLKSKQRPKNFTKLSSVERWQIDKQLGILDWDGF